MIDMAGSKKDKVQKGLAQRASGPLSRQTSTVTVGALERALLKEFPAADAEAWDRTGMTVGDPARLVEGVAVALDPTVDAVEEAASMGANVLVTHHPAFLQPPRWRRTPGRSYGPPWRAAWRCCRTTRRST